MKHSILVLLLSASLPGIADIKTKILVNGIAVEKQVKEPNTKYVLKSVYELNVNLQMPDNSTLEFDGGCLIGKGTLIGQNTIISAKAEKVIDADITLLGKWIVSEILPEWFGAKADGCSDDAIPLYKAFIFASTNKSIVLLGKSKSYNYNTRVSSNLLGKLSYLNLKGNNSEIKIGTVGDYECVFRCVAADSYSRVENLTLTIDDNNTLTPNTGREDLGTRRIEFSLGGITNHLGVVEINNVTVNNAIGVWQFDMEAATGYLKNSTINWSKSQAATYDRTSIYLNCNNFDVSGNLLNGSDYAHTGIEFHGNNIKVHNNTILNYDASIYFVNDVSKLGIKKISRQELYNNYIKTRFGVSLWSQNISNVDVDTVRISNNTIITTESSDNDKTSCISIYNVVGNNANLAFLIIEKNLLQQEGKEVYPIIDLSSTRVGEQSSILNNVYVRNNLIHAGRSKSIIRLEGNAPNFEVKKIYFGDNTVYCNEVNEYICGGYDNVNCYKELDMINNTFKHNKPSIFRVFNTRLKLILENNLFEIEPNKIVQDFLGECIFRNNS